MDSFIVATFSSLLLPHRSTRIDATLTRAGTGLSRVASETPQRLRELRKTPE